MSRGTKVRLLDPMILHHTNLETPAASKSSCEERTRPRAPAFNIWPSVWPVLIYCVSVLVIWPVVELATDDDFAYAKMALTFAHTGHFVFNGWETAIVGWQVAWGALFIRLFGYSYLTLRFSTLLLGAAAAFLLHRVLLRSGVSVGFATFGSVTVVLSPLFVPMATSYMTDVPALLCLVVVIYGCQRALRATTDRSALAWLCGSAALNIIDGTVRQIVWLGTLVMIPSAFWLLRHRKGFKTAAAITWLLSLVAILAIMAWFSRQPYALPEHVVKGPLTGNGLLRMLRVSVYGPLEIFCFSLPIQVAWIYELRTINRARKLQTVAVCAILSPFLLWAAHYNKVQGRLPPWSANVVSRYGILFSVPLMGDHPEILPISLTSILAAILFLSLAGFLIWLVRAIKRRRLHMDAAALPLTELTLRETLVLLLPLTAAYLLLLLPRAAFPSSFSDVYDRYYLPLIAVAVIILLRLLREKTPELPAISYVVLLFFSFFSITATHDLFSAFRTVAGVRAMLQAHGIPSTTISGPWEVDTANQIEAQGYTNDDRIEVPVGAYQKPAHPPLEDCKYVLGSQLPALHFNYVLTVEKLKCLAPSEFPDVTYSAWLPPYSRTIYIERNPNP